ncbi:MAG: FimB/Mfa2 family fimbrial subunit, partial [Odoribacteraceae bacterium]|nr:FimB/Mfa2 family fimbrial subunit [Odoribacteraceae bacterium]
MKQVNKTFLLAVLAMFAGACVVNVDDEREPAPVVDADGRVVTLSIAVPGPAPSRAMSTTTEGKVSTIDVLLFDKDTDKFRYWAIGSNVTPDDDHPELKSSFSVKLPTGPWTVVVLANARELLEASAYPEVKAAAFAGSSALSREELLESLVVTISAGDPWDTETIFPMWGYYKNGTSTILTVDENTSSSAVTINLTRAVVRVDVSVGV